MAGSTEEGAPAPDPRPDLPRIDLEAPLAGHWVKIDASELRMSDFETLEAVQAMAASDDRDGATMLTSMTKLLKLMRHVVVATSLPGETIAEALGELRSAEFVALQAALTKTASVPNGS